MLSRSHEKVPEPALPASPSPLSSTGRIPPIITTPPHLRPAPDIAAPVPVPATAAPASRPVPVPLSSISSDQHALLSRPDMYPPHSMSNAPHQQQQQQQQRNQYPYPFHQPGQPSYPQQPIPNQSQRILPPGAAGDQSGMLPPAHALPQPMSSYAAPSLPGPLPSPYETPQQQATPTTTTAATPSASSYAEPSVYAGTKGSFKYELRVEQQPQRARMCGFGDKDRRPITPPPCVRLVIRRADTNEEVKYDEIDGSFFVLQVDLWDAEGLREVNVIRASSSAPTQSISTAVPMSYPPPPERVIPAYLADMGWSAGGSTGFAMPAGYMYPQYVPQPSSANVMYTRNLIGSLTVNSSSLKDLDANFGYWFVLSDLSVRTEGWFRLRMSFIDVGNPEPQLGLNRSRSPVLASTFSDKFQVYSAKKFPGVIESTALSKCFAQQGIKIPIRKDGKGDKGDDDD